MDLKCLRLVKDRIITIQNEQIEKKIGFANFFSGTYRLFKIPDFDNSDGENYGLKVSYKGTISTCPDTFVLDNKNKFEKGKEYSVCGNTFRILNESRFNKHFNFSGNFDTHYGIMTNCDIKIPFLSFYKSDSCCSEDKKNESEQDFDYDENENDNYYYYPNYYFYQYNPWNYGNYYYYNK